MIVSIMQPAYLPWLGYFDRLWRSDLHVVLDSVPLVFRPRRHSPPAIASARHPVRRG